MTRRSIKYNIINNHENDGENIHSKSLCNGFPNRTVTRQSSQELLKVQCNGLTSGHRSSTTKLLSPSGSDVLPLPTSTKRSTRRASASWCGSTRDVSQLSPTDSEIENIVRENSLLGIGEEIENKKRCSGETLIKFSGGAEVHAGSNPDHCCRRGGRSYQGDYKFSRVLRCNDCSSFDSNDDEFTTRATHTAIKKDPDDYDGDREVFSRKMKNEEVETNGTVEKSEEEVGNEKRKYCYKNDKKSIRPGRKKKLSPEEKLLQDNKEYFKMEVLNTKLRSSGSLLNLTRGKQENEDVDKKRVGKIIIKKIKAGGRTRKSRWSHDSDCSNGKTGINGLIRKKKRQSELTKLCDEAENFMFGESSRQGTAGTENRVRSEPKTSSDVTSGSSGGRTFFSSEDKDVEEEEEEENDGKRQRRRKRRSHAEAFIHDNIDYYKFETPDSRLRYQNSQPESSNSSLNPIVRPGSSSDSNFEKNRFIPSFNRKKKRTEEEQREPAIKTKPGHPLRDKESLGGEAGARESVEKQKKNSALQIPEEISNLLFSFETVPSTEPWYNVYKRQDEGMENYYPVLSDPSDEPFLLPYELPKPAFHRSVVPDVNASEYYKRRKRKFGHVLNNHPRKSPRCHASTLAILSSLKKRKRRSGTNISLSKQHQEHEQETVPVTVSSGTSSTDHMFESSFLFFTEGKIERDGCSQDDDDDDDDETNERIILEPLSDSESKKNVPDSISKQEEESTEYHTTSRSRSRKLTKSYSTEVSSVCKHFLYRNIEPDSFFKDMIIETGKKSDLNINIVSILENLKCSFKNSDFADSADHSDFISDFDNCSSIADESNLLRRKRKKCRKINKTGWDNRKKSRRNKLTVKKMIQMKKVTCDNRDEDNKERKKQSSNGSQSTPGPDPSLFSDKRFSRRIVDNRKQKHSKPGEDERTKTKGRPHDEPEEPRAGNRTPASAAQAVMARRKTTAQENLEIHSRSESSDSRNSLEYSPCVVRVRKINQLPLGTSVKLRCSNGRYSIQSKRLISSRKKKRVMDYAWTTRKRGR